MFTKEISGALEENLKKEWLLTNGIGGYSSSTILGTNTRKYHGLLVAALGEHLDRYMTLSKINEMVEINGKTYSISTNECPNYIEKGYIYEEVFERKTLPEFLYDVKGVKIAKKIAMVYGENKVAIQYHIVNTTKQEILFHMMPFVNFRNHHCVKNAEAYEQKYDNKILEINISKANKLFIKVVDAEYAPFHNTFYQNMYYRVEQSRGFEATENHYIPGEFFVNVEADSKKEVIFIAEVSEKWSTEDKFLKSLIKKEEIRQEKICKIANAHTELEKELVLAADQFIIQKGKEKTIIAGYPWFNDWGRDTFIALEGLTLKNNRYSDAKSILKYFATYIKDGLVPNYIQDGGGQAYNTVDASLWYIEAVNKYISYTNDLATLEELYPKLLEIIEAYKNGTMYSIKMQPDGLISAGSSETQLTWMDAKIGDYIPTPRDGKAVEINALWYNALKVMENLSAKIEKEFSSALSKKVKESFRKFYTDDGLLDTIDPIREEIRPNQIIALSLSYPVVGGEKAIEILSLAKEKLLTDKGLRTLSSEDCQYVGRYSGDSMSRDSAYHQGTVWTWLLGEYAKAYRNIYHKKFTFDKIQELLTDGCIGSIAEIYDGDEPREANGALSQAWGVSAMIMIER